MVKVMPTKKSFNQQTKQLIADGFTKCGEYKNTVRYRKHVYAQPSIIVTLVQGWKQN